MASGTAVLGAVAWRRAGLLGTAALPAAEPRGGVGRPETCRVLTPEGPGLTPSCCHAPCAMPGLRAGCK